MDAQLTWTLWTVAHTLFDPVAEITGAAVDVEPSLAITFVLELLLLIVKSNVTTLSQPATLVNTTLGAAGRTVMTPVIPIPA